MKLPLLIGLVGALIFTTYHFENENASSSQGAALWTVANSQVATTRTAQVRPIRRSLAVRALRALVSPSMAVDVLPIRAESAFLHEQVSSMKTGVRPEMAAFVQQSTVVPANVTRTENAGPRHAASARAWRVAALPKPESGPVGHSPILFLAQVSLVTSTAAVSADVFSAAVSGAVAEIVTEVMVLCKEPGSQPLPTIWTMFNVSPKVGQADCHLLEFPGGKKVLIDAAEGYDAPGVALGFLGQTGVKHLDLVVLSHVHWDHYGRLIDIINSGIAVDRVALSLPASREIADAETPWGCNWDDVQSLLKFLRDHNIPYWTPTAGEKLMEVTQNKVTSVLEVVCCYDAINTPVGRTDVNDTSMLVRLRHGSIKALFTGDLNWTLGTWLATSDFDLKADLLKVPHHGTDGLAPNEFFDRVAPKAALVPSPRELWFSLRSKRAREYFTSRSIPTYVSGVNGTVKVRIDEYSYEITTSGVP